MLVSTSIFKRSSFTSPLIVAGLLFAFNVGAQSQPDSEEVPNPPDRDEENISDSPYTDYATFAEDEDEAKTTLFFQYGRFFGVSLGTGLEGVLGNRGKLYTGGFPLIDVRMHYWFDFNFGMDLQFFNVPFTYQLELVPEGQTGGEIATTDVAMMYLGFDIKYYFSIKDLSAPISYANPYLLVGVGNFRKSDGVGNEEDTTDSKVGFSAGGGLEFMISHKTAYFYVEGRAQLVNFSDRFDSFSKEVPDLTGMFYGASAGILFTW